MARLPVLSNQPTSVHEQAPALNPPSIWMGAAGLFARIRYPLAVFLLSVGIFLLARPFGLSSFAEGAYSVWDANWYGSIVRQGYQFNGDPQVQQNVAFFPMYPLLCSVVVRLTGWPVHSATFAVSAVCTAAAFCVLYRLYLRLATPGTARAALLLLAVNPFALYFYNGYSEPVFLLLLSLFFYFICVRERYFVAALIAGLISAARPYGCLFAIPFALELLRQHRVQFGFRLTPESLPLRRAVLYTPFCFAGLMAHTFWLSSTFGDAMAFSHAMTAWGAPVGRSVELSKLLGFQHLPAAVLYAVRQQVIAGPFLLGLVFFFLAPFTVVLWRKALPPVLLIFTGMMFLFFHLMGHHGYTMMLDIGRHMMVVFPLTISLALLLRPSQIKKAVDLFHDDPDSIPVHCAILATAPLMIVLIAFAILFARNTILHYQSVFVS